jgi:putative effector of murein hydrolase
MHEGAVIAFSYILYKEGQMLKRLAFALALATALALPVAMTVDAATGSAHACGARGICQNN